VTIPGWYRQGLERLVRYCARPPLSSLRRAAARCWALLLVRIYKCPPLRCRKCGESMRIIAFVLDRPQVERMGIASQSRLRR
jgi:hypothetical protein